MANTVGIREVTLAQISDQTHQINLASAFGTAPVDGTGNLPDIKQTRTWAYEPMVVRVTNHPADDGTATDGVDGFALFCSQRHGEPWVMIGHQTEHRIHPVAGVAAAPIVGTAAYSIIYVNYNFTTFE